MTIIPENFLFVIYLNPLYSYLTVFRGFMYGGEFVDWWMFAYMGATSIVTLLVGVWVFSRSWRSLVVLL